MRKHVGQEHDGEWEHDVEQEHVAQERMGQVNNVQDWLDEVAVDWSLDVELEDLTNCSIASVPVAFASDAHLAVHDL